MKATTKILLLGESGVGKTALTQRFVDGSFDNIYVSSVGVDFKTKLVRVGDKEVNLEIWDTAGQERFRSVASTYYRGSFGAIIVFDLTDKRSFEKVRYWVSEMKRELDKPYIVIVGNKTDLIEERAVNLNDIKQTFVNETYMECSAQSGKNVDEIFQEMAKLYVLHSPSHISTGSLTQDDFLPEDIPINITTRHKKKCC